MHPQNRRTHWFQEGHELDDKPAEKVPKAMIDRVLSRKEATAL